VADKGLIDLNLGMGIYWEWCKNNTVFIVWSYLPFFFPCSCFPFLFLTLFPSVFLFLSHTYALYSIGKWVKCDFGAEEVGCFGLPLWHLNWTPSAQSMEVITDSGC